METRLISLEKQMANLAERTSNRDNTNESNISETNSEISSVANTADVAEAQALFTALMTDTLLDEGGEE